MRRMRKMSLKGAGRDSRAESFFPSAFTAGVDGLGVIGAVALVAFRRVGVGIAMLKLRRLADKVGED